MIERKPFFWEIAFIILLFSVNILAQPTITQQPQPQTVNEGESATFSVSATSVDTLIYQWYRDGVSILGATSSTYTIISTSNSDNGAVFYCILSDSTASVESDNVTLTVIAGEAPSISQQPVDQGVLVGQVATFSVVANGTPPLQYQWTKNGVNIAGADSASYSTPTTISTDDNSIYKCIVTNNFGSAESASAYLYVTSSNERVSGGVQVLYNFNETSGETIHDVANNGPAEDIHIFTPNDVRWTPNGMETLSQARTSTPNKGPKIVDSCNISNEITIEVWIMPEFTSGQNGRRIFTNSLSGNFRNFSIIQNGSSYEFRLRTNQTDANGLPSISTSSGYVATTNLTHLTYTRDNNGLVNVYINGILDTSTTIGGQLDFSSNSFLAIGSEPYGGLEWRGVYYLASVYDRALTSSEVEQNYNVGVDVDYIPAFTIQPKDQFIIEGDFATFEAYAVSVENISYQWQKNNINIPGATERFLTLENIGFLDNGAEIKCLATTNSGSSESQVALLNVTPLNGRVNSGSQIVYNFSEGSGNIVNDVSGVGDSLNLNIFDTAAVQWERNGLRIKSVPSIITTNSASKVNTSIKASNEITIEAWVASSSLSQTNPARILTVSADGSNRNFSLGQNNDNYEVNIRTTTTDDNGIPGISTSAGAVSVNEFDHIVFTRSNDGTAKFYIDGTERISTTLSGDFSNWNDSYLLSLGNEFGVDNHWEGLVNFVAVFNRALNNSEVLRNYNFGPYGVIYDPSNLVITSNEIGKIILEWQDNSNNEEGFIIERGEGSPVVFAVLDTVSADSTSYTDISILDNKDYTYRIMAFNNIGTSQYSNEVLIHTRISPIVAPSNLQYNLLSDGYPEITWQDNSNNEDGFVIERRDAIAGAEYSPIDTVEANINSFTDRSVSDSTSYVYRVFAFNTDTTSDYSGEKIVDVLTGVEDNNIPIEYNLSQNYPNPFNPSTTIKFGLPESANVKIILYNILGQQISTLVSKDFSAGIHSINFNAENLTSGLYIYSIVAKGVNGKNFSATKKMVLLK